MSVAECLDNQETAGDACKFAMVGALRVGRARNDVDGYDAVISI